MNKKDIINEMAEILNITKKECERNIDAFFDVIGKGLEDGKNINFYGVMEFVIKDKSERKCRNPKTGEEIIVPAGKKLSIKAKKFLKEKLGR